MGSEKNYPIKILSKQLNNRTFSTLIDKPKLNIYFVSSLSDGESNFHISILKDKKYKSGWRVLASFQICLHLRDLDLLLQLQSILWRNSFD
jgi:hypothetical protein